MALHRAGKEKASALNAGVRKASRRDPKPVLSSLARQQPPELCQIGEVSGNSLPIGDVGSESQIQASPGSGLSGVILPETKARRLEQWRLYLPMHRVSAQLSEARRETLAELLSRLERADTSTEGWSACCPAHRDNNPSLSINVEPTDGRFLLYCHAGCRFEAIVDALGMEPGEMFESRESGVPRKARRTSPKRPIPPGRVPGEYEPSHADPKWAEMQKGFRSKIHVHHVKRLAKKLKVSYESLNLIRVGWCSRESCWTFVERNGRGKPCGFIRRFEDGKKLAMKGSKRGLTIPRGWRKQKGPIFICEGLTDVAAAVTYGQRAIGRPGINSGLADLAILLRDVQDDIVMVADNDEHGGGRIGAKRLAERLGAALGRRILLMAPPKGFKDIRDFYTQKGVG